MASKFYRSPVTGEMLTGRFSHVDNTPLSEAEVEQLARTITDVVETEGAIWVSPERDSRELHLNYRSAPVELGGMAVRCTTKDEIVFWPHDAGERKSA